MKIENYIVNKKMNINFKEYCGFELSLVDIIKALVETNTVLTTLPYSVYKSIDFKATSGMIGALFCNSITNHTDSMVNPIEKGYPDILPPVPPEHMNEKMLKNYPLGLEVKCTIGTVKTGKKLTTGETRIEHLKSFTWQAHHREGDRLLGLIWDFLEYEDSPHPFPVITGAFYSHDLVIDDWSKISGTTGRNTKVTSLLETGKSKMGKGWLAIENDREYIKKYNKELKIKI